MFYFAVLYYIIEMADIIHIVGIKAPINKLFVFI